MLVGLPLVDLVVVVTQRLASGHSPFYPDRNHVHHKILRLGFSHVEAAALIYGIQFVFVCSALFLRNASLLVGIAIYVVIAATLVASLEALDAGGWRAHRRRSTSES
jgi:UDP-GlcNAc:undecaprenyl-phosphate GlcNAc-1-phosphate transferase